MSRTERPAIFLDRDGTLNAEVGFVTGPEHLRVLPAARPALQRLRAHGYALVVVTNQSGIARGLYGQRDLAAIHAQMQQQLGGLIDAYLHCPHHPALGGPYGGACTCRKPRPGLLHEARELLGVSLAGSFVVGDSARDLLMARGLPPRTVLVRSGKNWREQLTRLQADDFTPDAVVDDIAGAADYVLGASS